MQLFSGLTNNVATKHLGTPMHSCFFLLVLTFMVWSLDRPAAADEVNLWHRMALYCSASENKAVLLAEGSWSGGELELPDGIRQLVSGMQREDSAGCTMQDGRAVRVTQSRLP